MLTKGNFPRDEWSHLLCLFNISHFSSAACSDVMSKRSQKESGEERVTAKSRPMVNLIARSSERDPSALSSTASESPGKTRQESPSLLSPQAEKYDRTGRPVVCSQQASQTRFSRDCKKVILEEEEANHDRTVRPVVCSQRLHQFVIEDDETESELSLGSRSFLHRWMFRCEKDKNNPHLNGCSRRQWRAFCDMVNVHVCNIGISFFHGKELLRQLAFHKEYKTPHNEANKCSS